MAPIRREEDGEVVVLRLQHGKVGALDLELLEALDGALAELGRDAPAALVLTGTGPSFSAGVDLFRIVEGGRAYIEPFLARLDSVLRALFGFRRPAVAALNGDAIAGGMVLGCACDVRLLARGSARLGVPEVLVGVSYPAVALEIVRNAVPPRALVDLVLGGRRATAEQALERGLVDELVEPERLDAKALALAHELGALDRKAFELAKSQLREPTQERLARLSAAHDAQVLEQWCAPTTRAAIEAYLERTIGGR